MATVLIALEIALACAVLCNACFLIAGRIDAIQVDSGVDEASLATVQLAGYENAHAVDLNARVLTGLGSIAGVQSVSLLNSIPFGARRGTAGITTDMAGKHFGGVVEFYVGGPGSLSALGTRLVAGRNPQPDDFRPFTALMPDDASVQVTRALAEHLWPGVDPLGKEFWLDKSHFRVVGVIDHLVRPDPGGWPGDSRDWSVFVPAQSSVYLSGSYLLRAAPTDLPRVLRDARAAIAKIAPDAVLDQDGTQTLGDLRTRSFQKDRAMIGMLVGVIVALLLVTALGIVGLASFWVAQRRRQIGIRRAIGATRRELPDRQLRHRAGHGAGLCTQSVADDALRTAAPAAGLPADRRRRTVAARPARRARPRVARRGRAAGGGDEGIAVPGMEGRQWETGKTRA